MNAEETREELFQRKYTLLQAAATLAANGFSLAASVTTALELEKHIEESVDAVGL